MVPNVDVAEVCWEAIRARTRQVGDPTLREWPGLDEWQRELITSIVRQYRMGATPREVHAQWAVELTVRGWRRGPWDLEGDPPSHPWLCPWGQLRPHGRSVFRLVQQITLGMTIELPDLVTEPA